MDDALIKSCRQTLQKNNLQPIKKLGKGSYGIVFLVSHPSSQSELYSVKCTYKKQFIKKPMLRRFLKQQITLMESLEHENIVKLIRTFQDDGWIFMVLEYCDIGNISHIQKNRKEGVFSFDECSLIMQQIVNGLTYMHNHNILHRDIKPQNILRKKVKNTVVTKICDLGFSHEGIEEVNTFCGTTYYMAPQIFQNVQYDWKVDVWALGVLMYTMLFGSFPFNGVNMLAEIKSKCKNGFDLSKRKVKENYSLNKENMKVLGELFQGTFELSPSKRISLPKFLQILNKDKIKSPNPDSSKKYQTLKTMDTDNSDEDSPKHMELEMQKVWFVQLVLDKVSSLQYLEPMQLLTLKFYLDKVCLSILNYIKQSSKKALKDKNMIDRLWQSQKRDSSILSDTLSTIDSKLKEIKIRKTVNFQEYKEEYRLVVGHAFYKAHKGIKNYELKIQTKLMLLCCHLINRVFERQYHKDLFQYYYAWMRKREKQQVFDLREYVQWIKEDEIKNISDTIEIINNKFYHKSNK